MPPEDSLTDDVAQPPPDQILMRQCWLEGFHSGVVYDLSRSEFFYCSILPYLGALSLHFTVETMASSRMLHNFVRFGAAYKTKKAALRNRDYQIALRGIEQLRNEQIAAIDIV